MIHVYTVAQMIKCIYIMTLILLGNRFFGKNTLKHYARQQKAKGMIKVQRSFHENACDINKSKVS